MSLGSATDGPARGGRLTDSCCPVINFFTTLNNAATDQQEHDLSGVVLPDAAAAGALWSRVTYGRAASSVLKPAAEL